MWTPLLLIALCVLPTAPESFSAQTEEQRIATIWLRLVGIDTRAKQSQTMNSAGWQWLELAESEAKVEFRASIEKLENATNHLVQELDIVRSRQAASAAVQASQVIMMVTYFLTIICTWGLSRCQKVSEKAKRKEFERLEMQLRSSKARRRAAAAKEKSAQAQSLE